MSIEKSVWPDNLKSAEVVPIHKAGSKSCISNYRPISLISNIAKIFEKILYNRLYSFLEKHQILSEHQYGFVKNKGTADALNYITHKIYQNLDKSKRIIATFLDLAKAFDTVNHDILLSKLERYGIRGKVLLLFKSYLSNRQQKVRIQNQTSEYKCVSCGVPQGTILEPVLFILYVNDLLRDMPEGSILSYADDTVIISSEDTWSMAQDRINQLLDQAAEWLALNKLSLNIQKTKFITFGNYRDSVPINVNINIQNQQITRTECYKYLGLIFDFNMKWDSHIKYLINRTKYLIFILAKLRKIMDTNTLMIIYYSFFHTVINYGIIAWGGACTTEIKIIQQIQNKLLKIIAKNKFQVHNTPLKVEQMFTLESLCYHYNNLKDAFLTIKRNTRKKSLQLPKMTKAISDKDSLVEAMRAFNELPNDLKILNYKKSTIKYKLKQKLFR